MARSWRLIFDASSTTRSVSFELAAICAVALVAAYFVYRRARGRTRALLFMAVVMVSLPLLSLIFVHGQLDRDRSKAAASARCVTHEGTVKVLHAEQRAGHTRPERIQVGQAVVEYSQYSSGSFYHQTIAHGGALTPGTRARVCLLRGRIVRAEIAVE